MAVTVQVPLQAVVQYVKVYVPAATVCVATVYPVCQTSCTPFVKVRPIVPLGLLPAVLSRVLPAGSKKTSSADHSFEAL